MIEGSTQISNDRHALKKGSYNEEQSNIKIDIAVIKQTMATKTDIAELKSELKSDLNTEFNQLRGEINTGVNQFRVEIKTDFDRFKSELKAELKEIIKPMATKQDLSDAKFNILKWMLSLFISIIISVGAMISPLWWDKLKTKQNNEIITEQVINEARKK